MFCHDLHFGKKNTHCKCDFTGSTNLTWCGHGWLGYSRPESEASVDQVVWCSPLPVGPVRGLECTAQQRRHGPEYQELVGEREARWLYSAIRRRQLEKCQMLDTLQYFYYFMKVSESPKIIWVSNHFKNVCLQACTWKDLKSKNHFSISLYIEHLTWLHWLSAETEDFCQKHFNKES